MIYFFLSVKTEDGEAYQQATLNCEADKDKGNVSLNMRLSPGSIQCSHKFTFHVKVMCYYTATDHGSVRSSVKRSTRFTCGNRKMPAYSSHQRTQHIAFSVLRGEKKKKRHSHYKSIQDYT